MIRDVGRAVEACSRFDSTSEASTETRPATSEISYSVIDRDFAGEESSLIRQQIDMVDSAGRPFDRDVHLYAITRVADLVAITC